MNYVPEPENSALLRCALGVFRKFSRFPEALRLALMLNDMELVEDIFTSCKDVYVERWAKGETGLCVLCVKTRDLVSDETTEALPSRGG